MAKDLTKVLKFIASKVEVGVSTGTEPGSYTDLGATDEVPVKIEMKPVTGGPMSDASEVQKAYECTVEIGALEILSISTVETALKNQQVWAKATPVGTVSASNPIIRVLNFVANFEVSLDLSVKGKTMYKITGKKYVPAFSDFVTMLAS